MKAVIYARVSTSSQTCENQLASLRAVAARNGWQVVRELKDEGISGAKGRADRPAWDELHRMVERKQCDIVLTWSIDRLGRSIAGLIGFMKELSAVGVDLYCEQQRLNTQAAISDPSRLSLKIRGKTGFRQIDSLEAAVNVYQRLSRRETHNSPDDYLFMPEHTNRTTAKRIMRRWFDLALRDAQTAFKFSGDRKHTPYSLRHTAICMRLVLSKFDTNIFTLARAAGTSVDMIENFYAKYLPPTPEMAKNLHSFGKQ